MTAKNIDMTHFNTFFENQTDEISCEDLFDKLVLFLKNNKIRFEQEELFTFLKSFNLECRETISLNEFSEIFFSDNFDFYKLNMQHFDKRENYFNIKGDFNTNILKKQSIANSSRMNLEKILSIGKNFDEDNHKSKSKYFYQIESRKTRSVLARN